MLRARIIPVLLLKGRGLYKTVQFKNPAYVGDPINAVRIFNEKGVDELLDIEASKDDRGPNFDLISEIVSEAFVPICYGGGVRQIDEFEKLFSIGVEKALVNTAVENDFSLISEASKVFGNQSVIVSIDYRISLFGKADRYVKSGRVKIKEDPVSSARRAEDAGAGEIMACCIDRDGTQRGLEMIEAKKICQSVDIPVVICGGASSLEDMGAAIRYTGASSAAAGSLFVYQGKHRAVLLTYPEYQDIERVLAHSD